MLEWIVGQWYLAVRCHICGWQFAFAPAIDRVPENPIELTCIDCKRPAHYSPDEIVRIQAH